MTHRTMIHCTMGSGAREGGRFPSAVAFRDVNIPELPWESETCACTEGTAVSSPAHPSPRRSPPHSEAAEVGHLVRHCGAECERKLGSGASCVRRARPAQRGQAECLPLAVPVRRRAQPNFLRLQGRGAGARAAPRRAPAKERAQGAGVAPAGVTAWRSTTLSSTDAQ